MTLNVIVNNFIAVDSEVSFGQRTSDHSQKSELFTRDNYHGVLIGCGYASTLLNAIDFLRKSQVGDLGQLMTELEKRQQEEHDTNYQSYIKRMSEEIKLKNGIISDPAKREEMIHREFYNTVEKFNQDLAQALQKGVGSLYIVAYDKKQKSLCKYVLGDYRGAKLGQVNLAPVITDGSGGDLAGAYLSTQTSGIDWNKISPAHNFYLVALACAAATANTGVGGFMRMIMLDESEVKLLEDDKVNAAVRVCCKQIAGDVSKKEAMNWLKRIYTGDANYGEIAQQLDTTQNDLLYVPGRVNQDVAKFNRLLVA